MKYFVVSDIHSFATPLKEALREAGFQKRNKNHTLIVCGDVFDRGDETMEVYEFLKSIPKKRCILIRGNHEDLYFQLLNKSFYENYDESNGTVKTFCAIAGVDQEKLSRHYYYKTDSGEGYKNKIYNTWRDVVDAVNNSEVTKWLASNQWRNYFEFGKFIFVHSFIPVENLDGLPSYYIDSRKLKFNHDWRNATALEWSDAAWGCPWKQYSAGLFKPEEDAGKVLVCGHWAAEDFWQNLKGIYGSGSELYYSKHLIALDGGVFATYDDLFRRVLIHDQNVLVIDENENCYDGNSAYPLEEPQAVRKIETVTLKD